MTNKRLPVYVSYTDEYLDWKLGAQSIDNTHPTNAIRAKIAIDTLAKYTDIVVVDPAPTYKDLIRVFDTHDADYVSEIVVDGVCEEWEGAQPRLGEVALTMFAGTVRCVEAILKGKTKVAFNPQGAKHHAAYDHSSGFCVFNDMAWAAKEFIKNGYKVMYIDFDAHHGDGVEDLLYSQVDDEQNPTAITCSIHDGTIFPGTGRDGHDVDHGVYNWALPANSGSKELWKAMDEIVELADKEKPDVILLAAGADGHRTDPLSTLQYGAGDFVNLGLVIGGLADKYCGGKILIGGAGGYQPLNETPQTWVDVVLAVHNAVQ